MKEIQRYSERDHFRGVNGGEKKKKKGKKRRGSRRMQLFRTAVSP